VRNKPAIRPILEHYGARVPRRHGWFSMKCPFHDDTHNSASANTDEGVFCCFACQIKGDGFALVMAQERVEFREAINIAERILNASGEVLPQRNPRSGGLPRRTGDYSGGSGQSTFGRRTRSANGS